jgi:hypothetical protein
VKADVKDTNSWGERGRRQEEETEYAFENSVNVCKKRPQYFMEKISKKLHAKK